MLDSVGTIEAGQLPGGRLIVSAHGSLDERIATEFRDTLLPVPSADGGPVVLDLGDAHGLDDVTVQVIARAAELVHLRGRQLAVVTRNPSVRALINASGADGLVRVVQSLGEAIRNE